jgi:hypothetical protein
MNQKNIDPKIRLFSQRQVVIATFLGSPFAGTLLMALNYYRTGQIAKFWRCAIVGTSATIMLMIISSFLPDKLVFITAIAPIFIMQYWYILFKQHISSGGRRSSWWTAIGIGLLLLFLIIGMIILSLGVQS